MFLNLSNMNCPNLFENKNKFIKNVIQENLNLQLGMMKKELSIE